MKNHLKVGALAKKVSLSVRTLHHYDEIGLLKPKATSEAGHRLYYEEDIKRLQQIISLKEIGFSLEQIISLLNKEEVDLIRILSLQRETTLMKMRRLQQMVQTLDLMIEKCAHNGPISIDDLFQFMKEMNTMEHYFTTEQLKKLEERLKLYPNEAKKVEEQWPLLFNECEIAMKKGALPTNPEVQLLAEKAQYFIDLFTGGDKDIEANLDRAYQQNQEMALKTWGVSEEVFSFLTEARKIYNKKRSS